MRELKNKERKILKVILLLSVIISMYFGLKGVFIDLYNPGSPVARHYNNMVNWMFLGTLITALPLLIEKFYKLSKWHDKFEKLSSKEQFHMLLRTLKPMVIQAIVLIVFVIIASIAISWYWQIPPDVMANYQDYYQGTYGGFYFNPKGIAVQSINISDVNNISSNITLKR